MEVVIYKQPGGSVAVLYPACNCGMDIHQIAKKDVPENCEWRIVKTSELPTNNEYYDAWRYAWPIVIDVEHAHKLKRDNMRTLREPILKKLDVEFMKRLEMGQDVSDITSKKIELRNVTTIDLPVPEEGETIDDFSRRLSEFTPNCLM